MTTTTTFEFDTAKTFTIADLIGSVSDNSSPRRSEKRGKAGGKKKKPAVLSSFKLSNKLAQQEQNPKKPKERGPAATNDILQVHRDKLSHFHQLQDSLPAKRAELQRCADPLKRKEIEREIASIEGREEEFAYLLEAAPILSEYVKATEDVPPEPQGILAAFGDFGDMSGYISKTDTAHKERLTAEYYRTTDPSYVSEEDLRVDNGTCARCQGSNIVTDGYVVCASCGCVAGESSEFHVSYRDVQELTMKLPFAYKRSNRFRECLSTLQAKENTEIPPHVIDAVQNEINKAQIADLTSLDTPKMKAILKRVGLQKYYEHSPALILAVNGLSPVNIPPHVEEQFNIMFNAIQEPFEIVRKEVAPKRKNFLSYPYILRQCSILLNDHELSERFPLLKSADKLRVQDLIWQGICELLDWEFHPSI
jgi:hypothetical protein